MKGDVHTFHLPARPIGKARPAFSTKERKDGSKFTSARNTQITEEGKFLLFCLNKWGKKKPILKAMNADFIFVFERPKCHWGTGRNAEKLKPSSPEYHIIKPDIDNIMKIILDSLNGIIFKDDSQVVSGKYEKRYAVGDELNSVSLVITELE